MTNNEQFHQAFLDSPRKHILNITNHGIHQWEIIPGLTDTGGQNVFVNQFSDELCEQGYKVTIINRGGYPHPISGEMRSGLDYKNASERIFYLEDGVKSFVRKEDMGEQIPDLKVALEEFLISDGCKIDLMITHYWDAALLGIAYLQDHTDEIPHIWVPHSLGVYKKRNVSPESWSDLHVDERINIEKQIVKQVDGIGATSGMIREMLAEDYDYRGKVYWLPPCIDTNHFYPRIVDQNDPVWEFLGSHIDLPGERVGERKIITEVSRTVANKRKDILIKAYAALKDKYPETLLVVSIDQQEKELAQELFGLIEDLGLIGEVVPVGSIWDLLPTLYAVTDIFCTPSDVEGFGMTPQEAAATKVPVVSSDGVPFATEYLLGTEIAMRGLPEDPARSVQIGEGAIIVPKGDVPGFTLALKTLLSDDNLRHKMGEKAYRITIPEFTWEQVTQKFLTAV
ncbi:MAG: glycosyltransferase, partial [Anaerolineales bacterium]